METKKIIEIDGVKVEVDLRTAKVVNAFKVGDKVKLLRKTYSGWEVKAGFICAIDAFKNLPTIVIAYIEDTFSTNAEVKFAYLNAESKEVEIAPMHEDDVIPNRETIVTMFDRAIAKRDAEINDIRTKKEFFLRSFGAAFGVNAQDVAEATK